MSLCTGGDDYETLYESGVYEDAWFKVEEDGHSVSSPEQTVWQF